MSADAPYLDMAYKLVEYDGRPVLEILFRTAMEHGRIRGPHRALTDIREYCAAQVSSRPEDVRRLHDPAAYPISYSQRLVALQRSLEATEARATLAEDAARGDRP